MKYKKVVLVLIILILQSCNVGTTGSWKNENIEKEKREEISHLNDKLFKAVQSNNITDVKSLMSDKLLKQAGSEADKIITDISNFVKADNYKILDEIQLKEEISC
ncbi:hypothetical protein [Flavobacterium gelatinilyticum]|uniref:hypothetical protein n=1 Tax=Flavobacterium gelatinilyticum TaxID=3003260 RepID=UPI00248035B1|nr:hypothetical protein [Flavobacterium gelatinilyticum]